MSICMSQFISRDFLKNILIQIILFKRILDEHNNNKLTMFFVKRENILFIMLLEIIFVINFFDLIKNKQFNIELFQLRSVTFLR